MVEVVLLRGEPPAWVEIGPGYGDGDGYGYGYVDGYGYGYGYVDGCGCGCGYGYGYGDGYGYGYGYGDGSYWLKTISWFATKWSDAQRARLKTLTDSGAKICFWLSSKNATACNGGHNEPVRPGTVECVQEGPLSICSKNALHGTLIPPKWEGERWWIVALIGEVQGDDEKYGALVREIIGECLG